MKKILILLVLIGMIIGISGCEKDESKTIKVGASYTPHSLILEQTRTYIEKKGYKLEIVVFDDYVLPNYAVENNEILCNYFQHTPYLDEFNTANNTHLKAIYGVHFEPLGFYLGKATKGAQIENNASIVVPSDKSNYDRAIELLESNGIDPEKMNIITAEAKLIPTMLNDCDYAVINGNYALSSKVIDRCIFTEANDSAIAIQMQNVIVCKEGNEMDARIVLLIEALENSKIDEYIIDTFGSSVIPMFNKIK